jgi:hypothetical protein
MEKIIETLTNYVVIVMESEIDIGRKYIIEKALMEALRELRYAQRLCKENNIELGD